MKKAMLLGFIFLASCTSCNNDANNCDALYDHMKTVEDSARSASRHVIELKIIAADDPTNDSILRVLNSAMNAEQQMKKSYLEAREAWKQCED